MKFVCTPAQHKSGAPIHPYFSLWDWDDGEYGVFYIPGRGFMDGCTTLWASWVVEQALFGATGMGRASVYFAG